MRRGTALLVAVAAVLVAHSITDAPTPPGTATTGGPTTLPLDCGPAPPGASSACSTSWRGCVNW